MKKSIWIDGECLYLSANRLEEFTPDDMQKAHEWIQHGESAFECRRICIITRYQGIHLKILIERCYDLCIIDIYHGDMQVLTKHTSSLPPILYRPDSILIGDASFLITPIRTTTNTHMQS